MSTNKEAWGSRVGLVLAMAGNAVGLGNFLRFPVQAVQNGGGAFIIPYLVCFVLMGIPLLWVEWSVGRFGGRQGNHSTPFILDNMSRRKFWKYFGVFGIFTNIAVAAYYTYIESWTLTYVWKSINRAFAGVDQNGVATAFTEYTDSFMGIPVPALIIYVITLTLNIYILSRGLSGGVEKVAKFGMPMLIVFGAFLAIRGLTLGSSGAPEGCTDCNSALALDFLWTPTASGIWDFRVWMAAAGQIFFTLSVGMGTIQCYASYVRSKDDIALNAMSAGWMNGFVEIVLGASVVIPIAVGYLGLEWAQQNAGFSMAFQTMPYLFEQWGPLLSILSGVMWFGLLFFAGITSSLAMGTPWMGFMQDEFNFSRNKAAWSFGIVTLIVGLPSVMFYSQGVFGEYDYWAGTIALVVFALAEVILFAWVFGMTKGWAEINEGSDIKIPYIFKYIIKWVTPFLLLIVFLGALVTPKGGDWAKAFSGKWELDNGSVIGQITNKGIVANRSFFADKFENATEGESTVSDVKGSVISLSQIKKYYRDKNGKAKPHTDQKTAETFDSLTVVSTINVAQYGGKSAKVTVKKGDKVKFKDTLATGNFTNQIFYITIGRLILVLVFVFVGYLVYRATIIRNKTPDNRGA
ncbi:MAG TPA: sodium:calcium symporter [Microscillaceae bacterium]|nr:sodium:calcium symporter [Microscillaceae bacterium]